MEPFDPYDGDPIVRAVVERAIEPYRSLPAEDLAELRDFLIVHVTTHPALAPLYEQLKKRDPADRSGTAQSSARRTSKKKRAANDK
jgi:hypothetical protein